MKAWPESVIPASPFQSFWIGGYEGADHRNSAGEALDMAVASGHIEQLEDDHRRAAALGIRTVRESIGWRLAEPQPGCFDLRRAQRIARSAQRHGLQVIWSLMHYGTPADVNLIGDDPARPGSALSPRLQAFAAAVAQALKPFSDSAPIFNPINEISFVAWAVSQSNLLHPYRANAAPDPTLGYAVKRRLVHAALQAVDAMRRVEPRARFMHIEPLVHVVPPLDRPDLAGHAAEVSAYQWQTWDMLAGLSEPQLGGGAHALDLIGVNHYHNSQWEVPGAARLHWHLRDPRRAPLAELLGAAWARYQRPLLVAETSHFGDGRAAWLDEIAAEVATARAAGVPVDGLCLYPLIDRPDWDDAAHWHRSGLWDVTETETLTSANPGVTSLPLRRVLCTDYAQTLARWQAQLPAPAPARASVSGLFSGSASAAAKSWLVVLSPLPWDSLWQRPQQLLTRLSGQDQTHPHPHPHHHVLFIEAPQRAAAAAPLRLERISCGPAITRLVPHLPGIGPGFDAATCACLAPALAAFVQVQGITNPCVWLGTPMAQDLLDTLHGRVVVYDVPDRLGATAALPESEGDSETTLLRRADLVLTSGPSQHAALLQHPAQSSFHCIANSVDAAHFDPSRLDPHSHDARETRRLLAPFAASSGPRLGYAGAVDSRLDLALIEALADARPQWQFMLVGAVNGPLDRCLPQRANLHWLGAQPYARLPHLYASWEVCLLPFALNAATRLSNPLQLLEYLAADKPVVSTPVPDAVTLHGATVQFASDTAGFIAACEQVLANARTATPAARQHRAALIAATLRANHWDARAAQVLALLDAVPAR